ncbi:MurR/RpiR family transcriptional regulator [Microbacterium capsulatum]|uniref:MurR/RpiR family transcriptional regulator n=1 Tax=Microbacterium capsulatum TaxID=3041921 RepID=A0ABU0XB51_9MICO|nr:MurR/RpiR family transcriptional regulator [Microbacterium sp. ASV81]MDQ4212331.1 MurR/RpiR family transcriptional regulator [Microbacterium sp. ASV81]
MQEVGNELSITQRISLRRPAMPRAMAKIAEVILAHPTAPVELTITELADRAGTSPATVTRFCRAIGFDGYTQFRVGVAAESGRGDAGTTWRTDIADDISQDDPADRVLLTLLGLHTRSMETTTSLLDLDDVQLVARAIAESRHVDIYGVGGSGVIAEEFRGRLYRIGVNAHSWSDVHDGLTSAVLQDGSSVAVGISNTGSTEETIEMLSHARAAGALTVAITARADSWLASIADVAFITSSASPTDRPDDLSIKHAQLLVIDLLYVLVAQRTLGKAATRLAASAMAVSSHRRATPSPLERGPRREKESAR